MAGLTGFELIGARSWPSVGSALPSLLRITRHSWCRRGVPLADADHTREPQMVAYHEEDQGPPNGQKCLAAKARPECDLRYLSNAAVLSLSGNASATLSFHGRNRAV